MIQFNDELKEISKKFRKQFGYSVPMAMIPPTTDNATLIGYLEACIENNKDDLLERFNVKVNDKSLV
ncbi:MAG: hypothetical protein ACLU5E_01695 [Anaerovoracaceae bacterium]